jgi:hypothetical protein
MGQGGGYFGWGEGRVLDEVELEDGRRVDGAAVAFAEAAGPRGGRLLADSEAILELWGGRVASREIGRWRWRWRGLPWEGLGGWLVEEARYSETGCASRVGDDGVGGLCLGLSWWWWWWC